jgi:hypothetical protein
MLMYSKIWIEPLSCSFLLGYGPSQLSQLTGLCLVNIPIPPRGLTSYISPAYSTYKSVRRQTGYQKTSKSPDLVVASIRWIAWWRSVASDDAPSSSACGGSGIPGFTTLRSFCRSKTYEKSNIRIRPITTV